MELGRYKVKIDSNCIRIRAIISYSRKLESIKVTQAIHASLLKQLYFSTIFFKTMSSNKATRSTQLYITHIRTLNFYSFSVLINFYTVNNT